jgi:hypothetical protein
VPALGYRLTLPATLATEQGRVPEDRLAPAVQAATGQSGELV